MKLPNKKGGNSRRPGGGGLPKWVRVDDLSRVGKALIGFEPGELVRVKGVQFEVEEIHLDSPMLVLVKPRNALKSY